MTPATLNQFAHSASPGTAGKNLSDTGNSTILFTPFEISGQQSTTKFGLAWDAQFPYCARISDSLTIDQIVEAIRSFSQSGELKSLVKLHGGALLLRGLPIATPDDYSRIAHALGFAPHVEVGRPPLRTVLAPNVKTANEGYVCLWNCVLVLDAQPRCF